MYRNMLAVTNRQLCQRPFLEQLDWLASQHPSGIILREKDLSEQDYLLLARKVLAICKKHGVDCILHSWPACARTVGCENIHLPMWKLRMETDLHDGGQLSEFHKIGVSVHSVEDAIDAQRRGATYLIAGHIFPTACKSGVPARGLEFLHEICNAVTIPVYGIGGITEDNCSQVIAQGAAGYCMMSGAMNYKK